MKVAGDTVLNAPVEGFSNAVLDPQVSVNTIPGCERLESPGEDSLDVTVSAGVASLKGTDFGVCHLRDFQPNSSLLMRAEGSGARGMIGVDVQVGFADLANGTTQLTYDADAVVGGTVGGMGPRLLTSVSELISGTFLSLIDDLLSDVEVAAAVNAIGAPAPAPTAAPASAEGAQSAGQASAGGPARTAGPAADEILKGIVGAGLVLRGVGAGAFAGRRRDWRRLS